MYKTTWVAVVAMDKYLIIKKKTGKGSSHNEHHEKVKCKTLAEKDT